MQPVYKVRLFEEEKKLTDVVLCWTSGNWLLYALNIQTEHMTLDTVHFFNPNRPNDGFSLQTQHTCLIRHICWVDDQFVTVDEDGYCKVWSNADCNRFMNNWKCLDTFSLGEGDQVIAILILNNELSFNWDMEMSHQKDLMKKFSSRQSAMLTVDEPCIEIVALTSTGVINLVTLKNNEPPTFDKAKLVLYKSFIYNADIKINNSGKLFAAIQTDPALIELFTVKLTNDESCKFIIEVSPCIVPQFHQGFQNITSIECVSFNSVDHIVVTTSDNKSSGSAQVFTVKKEVVQLHPQFSNQLQQAAPLTDACVCLKTVVFPQPKQMLLATTLNFASATSTNEYMPLCLMADCTTLQFYSICDWRTPLHACEPGSEILRAVLSPCQHGLFAIGKDGVARFYVLSMFPSNHKVVKVNNLVSMLQYSIFESFSPWAMVLSICVFDRHLLDHCIQQFMEEFKENSSIMQSSSDFKKVYRLLLSTKKDNVPLLEYTYSTILSYIYLHISSLLINTKEAAFFEASEKVCLTSKEVEMSKIISQLDTKDLNVTILAIPANRPLIQWVVDYSIHFARLVLSKDHCGQNWKNVVPYLDSKNLLLLRKLLVLIYVMYQKSPKPIHAVFPVMVDSLEMIALLFKLTSKLQQICDGDINLDVLTVDLPFNSLPMMHLELPAKNLFPGVLEDIAFTSSPLTMDEYEANTRPIDFVRFTDLQNPLYAGIHTVSTGKRQFYDSVNFTNASLMQGEILKQCVACGCCAVQVGHATRTYITPWSTNWHPCCFCGGDWIKVNWYL